MNNDKNYKIKAAGSIPIKDDGGFYASDTVEGALQELGGGGGGDVTGPASSTNNNIAVFDGITGKVIKDGGATVASKQDALVSGTNIKTINSTSLLGSGDISISGTDEKVKYDAGDPTAGYVADKVIAGTGISVAEGTAGNENKLVVSSTITQATRDSLGLDTDDTVTFANLSGTNTGDETATTLGTKINGATAKTTPVDADNVAITDSAASHILKKLTWANLKATLKTYFDTIYQAALGFTAENVANKRTSFQATPTDTAYPTEKLVKDSLDGKQATLVSGTNIKTVNSTSLLGSGDLAITVPVKATGAELDTGTDDAKFATAKALADSKYVKSDETATFTNKRITPRLVTAASYTTDTGTSLDFSTCDQFEVTAQAGALKFNNPSGTPVAGQKIIIRVKDNGTARALTYDTQYRAIGVTLPDTTVINKTTYLGGIWNATDTKLDIVAVAQEA